MIFTSNDEKINNESGSDSEKVLVGTSHILGENIKKLIQQNNINITQLANSINLPIMTIRRIISGETSDPRISTIKLFADYFKVTIDSLLLDTNITGSDKYLYSHTTLVPQIDWDILEKINSIEELDLENWQDWQPVTFKEAEIISKKAFALYSKPFMYSRFPQGTVFIVDPSATAGDGDLILVKMKNNEVALKELYIDPPEWYLNSIINNTKKVLFNNNEHKIIGVILLTMLYNRK